MPADQPGPLLPPSLHFEVRADVAILTLNRPEKRNALDDRTVLGIETVFSSLSGAVKAVVINAAGAHFCAGLDLSALGRTDSFEGLQHSMMWHRALAAVESGPVPVICVLKGAVIGGGLELACATHLRVAEESTFYALPEGQRGLFVGGGGSIRVPRLIGTSRMADMMLTGRVFDAGEGQAMGLSHYLAPSGEGLHRALELAAKVATNAPITTFAVLQALPRIADANPREGYLLESLMSAVAQGSNEAKYRIGEFLSGRAAAVNPATTDPATTDPATTDPATTDPATTDPATTDTASCAGWHPAPGADRVPRPT